MKKLMYIAAALLVLVGCQKKENVIENAPQNLVTITGGIDFSAQDGPNKVAAKEGWENVTSGNQVGFVWETGDKIAVLNMSSTEVKQFTVTSISEDKQTATFTGEPLSSGMESQYVVLYPYEYGESIVHGTQYEFFANQQYTGKLRPAFMAMGSGDSFNVLMHFDVFDLSLKGSVKLGKIKYHTENGGESDAPYDATLSFGEGLQLTNEPQHVTFTTLVRSSQGFKLSFYDTDDQLIMEKISTKNITETGILSFPTLEVKAATMHNGHEYVDLGLPSGIMWATCNVGVTAPEGYGDYFAWGEKAPYYNTPITNPITWKEDKTSGYVWLSYCGSSSFVEWDPAPYDDNKILKPEYDAANVKWGGAWRMPTYAELDELITKCTWTWTQKNGINGYEVEGPNKNTIFLPAAGYYDGSWLGGFGSGGGYWSSSLYMSDSGSAYFLSFNSGYKCWDYDRRRYGRSVRPVYKIVYK